MWKHLLDMHDRYRDRADAGRQLAARLTAYGGRADAIVLGLARGGVAVAAEIASALDTSLDVVIARKLGVPGYEELAMGALASGGWRVLNDEVVTHLGISPEAIERVVERELREIERRERLYRRGEPPPDVRDRIAIVVDDGLATGATMRAAMLAVRAQHPDRLVVAVPVGAPEACADIRPLCDVLLCLLTPPDLQAIGLWYEDFPQLSDDEVRALLDNARHQRGRGTGTPQTDAPT